MDYLEFKKAYDAIDEKVRDRFFKGGEKDAAIAISTIFFLLKQYPEVANSAEYIFDLYKFTVTRCEMGMSVSRMLLSFELPPYNELPAAFVLELVMFVKMHLDDPLSYFASSEIKNEIHERINIYKDRKRVLESATKPNESSYGLILDNPIMLTNIPKAYSFIDRLVPKDGRITESKRLFSTSSTVIPDILDEYEITVKRTNGKTDVINLFIDSYGEEDIEVPPEGFTLNNSSREESLTISLKNVFYFNQLHPMLDYDTSEDLSVFFRDNISAIKYCRKCGFELLPDSMFCSMCGTKVE